MVATYEGRKRQIYQAALESLQTHPLTARDGRTSTFVKAEKVEDKAPRVIQPRTSRFHLELGVFIKPIEHRLYNALARANGECSVAKGLNQDQRGKLIAEKFFSFNNPVALGLDASRFDQHVSVEALEYCHKVYLDCFPNKTDKDKLRRLLRMTIDNSGTAYAKDGKFAYKVRGCRMSGDMDTSLGNCLLMSSMVMAFRRSVGMSRTQMRFINDGDDCVLFFDRKHLKKVSSAIKPFFRGLGFTMKVDSPAFCVEKAEFCQSRAVRLADGYRMVRNPKACMAKDLTCLFDISTPAEFSRWVRAVGDCGLSLASGVPVLQEFYQGFRRTRKLWRGRNHFEDDFSFNMRWLAKGMAREERVVTDDSRASFYFAFGIEPSVQVDLERKCRQWTARWQKPEEVAKLEHLHYEASISELLT